MSPYNFLFVDQSSRSFISPNVEGVVVNKILFRFAICRSVPEIFAIKVESCQKSHRIFDIFSRSQILGAALPKLIPILSTLPCGTSPGKGFVRIFPLGRSYRGSHAEVQAKF